MGALNGLRKALSGPVLVVLVLALVVVGILFVRTSGGQPPKKVTAYFQRAVSIYPGTDVDILGVKVGKVTSVTPHGATVRVDMEYDAKYDVPADAHAVIVTPTLVSDRFIQLTPVWTKGDTVMASGAEIPCTAQLCDTQEPVELDEIYHSLDQLSTTLGPNGINKDGTLNHVVSVGAKALQGEGARGNQLIRDLAKAAATFGNSSGNLFGTVKNLADFTGVLKDNDGVVRGFIGRLAGVTTQLAGERGDLRKLLATLAGAVDTVHGFVKNNRQLLVTDVDRLTRVLSTINSERSNIDIALKIAPVAIGNLVLAYDAGSGTIGSQIGVQGNVYDADGFLCDLVQQTQLPAVSKDLACQLFKSLLTPVEKEIAGQAGGGNSPLPLTHRGTTSTSPGNRRPAPPSAHQTGGVTEPTPAQRQQLAASSGGGAGPPDLATLVGGDT